MFVLEGYFSCLGIDVHGALVESFIKVAQFSVMLYKSIVLFGLVQEWARWSGLFLNCSGPFLPVSASYLESGAGDSKVLQQ